MSDPTLALLWNLAALVLLWDMEGGLTSALFYINVACLLVNLFLIATG